MSNYGGLGSFRGSIEMRKASLGELHFPLPVIIITEMCSRSNQSAFYKKFSPRYGFISDLTSGVGKFKFVSWHNIRWWYITIFSAIRVLIFILFLLWWLNYFLYIDKNTEPRHVCMRMDTHMLPQQILQ